MTVTPQESPRRARRCRDWRRFSWRSLPWLTVLIVMVLLALPLLGDNGVAMFLRLRGQRDQLQQEVGQLEATTDSLTVQIDRLATDPAALEQLAREQYNMRRPQEQVLLLVTPPQR